MGMKIWAILILFPAAAFGVAVGSLPPSEFVDTEVTTNLPISVDLAAVSRMEFSLSLEASTNGCIEVSVGTDADGDGILSLDEVERMFGWRCGLWFWGEVAADEEAFEEESRVGRIERTFLLRKSNVSPAWNLVRVVRRGVGELGEIVFAETKRPGATLYVR